MPHTGTYYGEEVQLLGGSGDGGFARMATKLKLYTSASSPAKDGSGFVEVANGNGYTTGGQSIARSNWAYTSAPSKIKLDDFVWTASGGSIADIAGAYITDVSGNVMAWWERTTPLTLLDGESVTADDLTIEAA
jgi:hypothetical protein